MPFVPQPDPGGVLATELKMQRRQTNAFIAAKPIDVRLNRVDTAPNGSGGFTRLPPTTQPEQRLRLQDTNYQTPIRQLLDGEEVQPQFVLIGPYDADIQRGDWFFINGKKYEVVFVHENTSYEVKAEVVYRG